MIKDILNGLRRAWLLQNLWGNPIMGKGTKIAAFVEIGRGVKVGKNCKIQAFTFIPPGVTIEDDVFIGPHVCFTNDRHINAPKEWDKTLVKRGAKIGAGTTIIAGVTIGENSFVAAGSLVTKDVPDGAFVKGRPSG